MQNVIATSAKSQASKAPRACALDQSSAPATPALHHVSRHLTLAAVPSHTIISLLPCSADRICQEQRVRVAESVWRDRRRYSRAQYSLSTEHSKSCRKGQGLLTSVARVTVRHRPLQNDGMRLRADSSSSWFSISRPPPAFLRTNTQESSSFPTLPIPPTPASLSRPRRSHPLMRRSRRLAGPMPQTPGGSSQTSCAV